MATIRCSKLPLAMACPGSAFLPQPFNLTGPEAALGTAVHSALARFVKGGVDAESLFADRWGLLPDQMDDFRYLLGRGIAAMRELGAGLQNTKVEHMMEAPLDIAAVLALTGSADVYAEENAETVVILDWKTGYPDGADYTAQMRGYAKLALWNHPTATVCKAVLVWLRSSEIVVRQWTRAEIDGWVETLLERLQHKSEFCPGDCCKYCGARDTCQPRIQTATTAARDLLAIEPDAEMTPAALVAGWGKVKAIKQAIERYESALRLAVSAAPGGLPLPDGRRLVMERKEKDELHLNGRALEVIGALGIDALAELSESIRISKTALMDRARKTAGRGMKQKVADKLLADLDAVGAVQKSNYEAMTVKGADNA